MKSASRKYSVVTNTCLVLGVASAFGFDSTSHVAWLVLGGCSAAVAIAAYVVRHWQPKPRSEPSMSASFLDSDLEGTQSEAERLALNYAQFLNAAAASAQVVSHRADTAWNLPPAMLHSYWSGSAMRHDPAEQVARIVKRLHATGKRRIHTVAISPDGHITLKFTDAVEQPKPRIEQPIQTQVPEIVH